MPRLPFDLMTAGVRQELPSPTYQTQSASAADFGAGSNGGEIGQALQRAGEAGGNLAGKIAAYQEKEQKFDATLGLVKAQDADSQAFEEHKRTIDGNGDGFWQKQRDVTRKNMDTYLQTLPEGLRKEFAVQAEQLVAGRTKQAFQVQYAQADANTKLQLDEQARKAGLQVNEDPGAYEKVVGQQIQLIENSPLTPLEKTQKIQALKNTLAYQAEQAKAQQDPAGVVAAGVGGGLRDKIRGKESGGNDTAQNPTSSARGRYQFLDTTWNAFAAKAGVPAVTGENRGGANDPRNNGDAQEKVMDQYIAASTAELTANKLPVTDANLYLLHFMGQKGGTAFLRAMNNDASATAAAAFPAQAKANTSIFYGGKDREARSLSEVFSVLTKGLNGTGTTPSAVSAARSNLTAEQTNAVNETARRSLVQQQAMQSAANDAALTAQREAVYMAIKEGPNPEASLREGRASGAVSGFDQVTKGEKILADRYKGDDDLQVGIGLMGAGRAGSNQLDKSHKDGIDAVYKAMSKLPGSSEAAAAAATFDRTGIVAPSYALKMQGDLLSQDPARVGSASRTAANMIVQNPNALVGVEGKERIEAAATEYNRLTKTLGLSEEDAVKSIVADAGKTKEPLKDEVFQQFKKDYLSVDKLDRRMQSKLSNWYGGGAALPEGNQRSTIGGIYSSLAEEGMRQFQNPDRALDWADFQMQKQFGTQNGVIMRYPPGKILPKLEGKDTAWANEQGADVVKDQLGIVVDPKQVQLVPVEVKGASTSRAYNEGGMTVTRDDSKPGQQSQVSHTTIPYQIVVMPTPDQIKAGASVQHVPGVFFPDVDDYVAKSNQRRNEKAAKDAGTMLDIFGQPYPVPAHAPEQLDTPEQAARRKKAATDAELLARQQAERDNPRAMPLVGFGTN